MSLISRIAMRMGAEEDTAAPLRLSPKDRGTGSRFGARSGATLRREDAPEESAAPLRRQDAPPQEDAAPLRREESEIPNADAARPKAQEDDAPAAPLRRTEAKPEEEDSASAAPLRRAAQSPPPSEADAESAAPMRPQDPEPREAAPLRRSLPDTEEAEAPSPDPEAPSPARAARAQPQIPEDTPPAELRHETSMNTAQAAHRRAAPIPAIPAPFQAPAPLAGPQPAAPEAQAPVAEGLPFGAPPIAHSLSERPKVVIDQIDVIVEAPTVSAQQNAGLSTASNSAAPASSARALLARRWRR